MLRRRISLDLDVRASMGPRPIGRGNSSGSAHPAASRPIASMGPRPIGRGNLGIAAKWIGVLMGFNGAATNWSRKSPRGHSEKGLLHASMGPRPIGRGNPAPWMKADANVNASMGPRPIGRGNDDSWPIFDRKCCAASMGPRPIGRGNDHPLKNPGSRRSSFNGAATNWSRKSGAVLFVQIRSGGFNGAATNWSRKSHRARADSPTLRSASMGPRPIGRGNRRFHASRGATTTLQWGRDQLVAEIPADRRP